MESEWTHIVERFGGPVAREVMAFRQQALAVLLRMRPLMLDVRAGWDDPVEDEVRVDDVVILTVWTGDKHHLDYMLRSDIGSLTLSCQQRDVMLTRRADWEVNPEHAAAEMLAQFDAAVEQRAAEVAAGGDDD